MHPTSVLDAALRDHARLLADLERDRLRARRPLPSRTARQLLPARALLSRPTRRNGTSRATAQRPAAPARPAADGLLAA